MTCMAPDVVEMLSRKEERAVLNRAVAKAPQELRGIKTIFTKYGDLKALARLGLASFAAESQGSGQLR